MPLPLSFTPVHGNAGSGASALFRYTIPHSSSCVKWSKTAIDSGFLADVQTDAVCDRISFGLNQEHLEKLTKP